MFRIKADERREVWRRLQLQGLQENGKLPLHHIMKPRLIVLIASAHAF